MNAFLLGLAAAGALLAIATTKPADIIPSGEELGSMTREYSVSPDTGDVEETSIMALRD
jgi:hypothetical protein